MFEPWQLAAIDDAGYNSIRDEHIEREERQKEYERKRAEREAWKMEHMSSEKCPLCGNTMYIREGKYGKFLGCSNYPNCKGTRKIK